MCKVQLVTSGSCQAPIGQIITSVQISHLMLRCALGPMVVILSVVPTTTVTQAGAIIIMVITEKGILVSAFIDR